MVKLLHKAHFYCGLIVAAILFISYLVPIPVDSGANYIVTTSLLGIIIFHNPFIFGLYILAAIYFVVKGLQK